jgi:glycerol-1-phosphate dehydrogenase [NAD(P)+]
MAIDPIYIGNDALSQLLVYCKKQNHQKFLIVSDANTQVVLGKAVQEALNDAGCDVILAELSGEEVIADENYLLKVFLKADREDRIFISVGSGTLTDITRFVSHRTKTAFIAMPTAPSVDGYNSIGAPLVIGGLKQTIICHPPVALFADLSTLVSAPPLLISSGFADAIGKFLSIADWKLGHILWNEPYDVDIEKRSRKSALITVEVAQGVKQRSENAIRVLMDGLIESGFCMLDFGNSSPASGAEHHLSHYWEMMLLNHGRPAVFHGLKVGIASIITAGWFEQLRSLSRADVEKRLNESRLLAADEEVKNIKTVFPTTADEIIKDQAEFLFMTEEVFDRLKGRIVECWDEVLAIAEATPTANQMTEWLKAAGAPTHGSEIGLSNNEIEDAKRYGHYLRRRFTINKLRLLLGIQ